MYIVDDFFKNGIKLDYLLFYRAGSLCLYLSQGVFVFIQYFWHYIHCSWSVLSLLTSMKIYFADMWSAYSEHFPFNAKKGHINIIAKSKANYK